MIYITGDTHIPTDIHKLSMKMFPQQREMTKEDYVIICGDFGGVWDKSNEEKYWIKWLKNKNFTTLFVDGNHENFEMLNALPKKDFCGGIVHRVDAGIYHLMRGEIYDICGKKIFTMGGGESHDKKFRKEGKNWWREEMPSLEEYEAAEAKLKKNAYNVDFVITHSAPSGVQEKIGNYEENELTLFLRKISGITSFQKWYFGHYHKDMDVDEKYTAVFDRLIKL